MKFELRKGFTLIELLVAIAIIGILSTIGLAAFTQAQTRARDARRRGDMKDIQNSFEQYYVNNANVYLANCGAGMDTYLQGGRPTDPKGGAAYNCTSSTTQYCVCSTLENTTAGNATSQCGANGAPPSWGAGTYYCVRNLQ